MPAVGVPEGTPVDELVVGDLVFGRDADDRAGFVERQIRHEDLQEIVAVTIAAIGDATAVRREERPAVVSGRGHEMRHHARREILDVDVALARFERGVEEMPSIRGEAPLGHVSLPVTDEDFERPRRGVRLVQADGDDPHLGRKLPSIASRPPLVSGCVLAQW